MVKRYLILLSYKGTNYHGWQIQPNAITIQEIIEKALSILLREKVAVVGAGRTDTGVHAKNYVAHFDTKKEFDNEEKFLKNFNGIVGNDIVISKISEVQTDFHSRFSAKGRTYKYYIHTKKNPFVDEFSYHLK